MSQSSKDAILKNNQKVVAAGKIAREQRSPYREINQHLDRIKHLAKEPLSVAVMGEFSAGKSSFLNRLLNRALLPTSILPKTATLTRLVWGEEAKVTLCYRAGDKPRTKQISLEEFNQLQTASQISNPLFQQELDEIEEVQVAVNDPTLKSFHLLDTPGFNHDNLMDAKTQAIAKVADILIWLADCIQPFKQTEYEQLEHLHKLGKPIWLVINKGDVNINSDQEHREAVERLREQLKESGFDRFFRSDEILLISSKEQQGIWDGHFVSARAHLKERILTQDMSLSSELIDVQWQQLTKCLEAETQRYKQLAGWLNVWQRLLNIEQQFNLAKRPDKALLDAFRALHHALDQRFDDANKHNRHASSIPSLNAFTMACTQSGLDAALEHTQRAYQSFFAQWQCNWLSQLRERLDTMDGLIPESEQTLKALISKIRSWLSLISTDSFKPDQTYNLPALRQSVEMLDHLGIQFGAIKWKFTDVLSDGVLGIFMQGTDFDLKRYRESMFNQALSADWKHDMASLAATPLLSKLTQAMEQHCTSRTQFLAVAMDIVEGVK
ncbi:MAG: dynamin family protein [Gammaproteobacteria bacterium]|nr:dynamin family protein [Gammaproteobacteria bacterium]